TEPCQAIRYCPDIHNTGVWILCGRWKIFTYPHSVETPVVEPEPFRSLVDAGWMTRPPASNGRLTPLRTTPSQASSPKIRSPTRPPPHRRQSASSQAKRGVFPSEGRPYCGLQITPGSAPGRHPSRSPGRSRAALRTTHRACLGHAVGACSKPRACDCPWLHRVSHAHYQWTVVASIHLPTG